MCSVRPLSWYLYVVNAPKSDFGDKTRVQLYSLVSVCSECIKIWLWWQNLCQTILSSICMQRVHQNLTLVTKLLSNYTLWYLDLNSPSKSDFGDKTRVKLCSLVSDWSECIKIWILWQNSCLHVCKGPDNLIIIYLELEDLKHSMFFKSFMLSQSYPISLHKSTFVLEWVRRTAHTLFNLSDQKLVIK